MRSWSHLSDRILACSSGDRPPVGAVDYEADSETVSKEMRVTVQRSHALRDHMDVQQTQEDALDPRTNIHVPSLFSRYSYAHLARERRPATLQDRSMTWPCGSPPRAAPPRIPQDREHCDDAEWGRGKARIAGASLLACPRGVEYLGPVGHERLYSCRPLDREHSGGLDVLGIADAPSVV